MQYLLLWERWNFKSYDDFIETPQWVIDDMMLVMEAESRVEEEKNG